jgi:hypothetical protein
MELNMTCKDKDYYKCDTCVDAWELSKHYSCNESPNPVTDMDREVEVGDCVEVNNNGDRFWIEVTDVCVCFIIGIILGPFHNDQPFSIGDKIRVEIYQIYNVDKGCSKI